MIDPRFYSTAKSISLQNLARISGSEIGQGDAQQLLCSVSAVSEVRAGVVAYIRSKKDVPAKAPVGGVLIIEHALFNLVRDWPVAILLHPQPGFALAEITNTLITHRKNIDPKALVSSKAKIDKSACISANVAIGDEVVIGAGTTIGPNSTIGYGVHIGDHCKINAGVHISFAQLGNHVSLSSGVVIGGAGLGVVIGPEGLVDVPHCGNVIIEDYVSIGSNTTIDRGMFSSTHIGKNSKIDNLVQIAHNVRIGENCVLAGHVGLSGSVSIGDRVLIGGKVGVADHLTIGSDVKIYASSGVMTNIPSGETWAGVPAMPYRQFAKSVAMMRKLSRAKKRTR